MFPKSQVLDIAGPVSVFEAANAVLDKSIGYDVKLVSSSKTSMPTSGCISMDVHETYSSIEFSGLDTILVPGGSKGTPDAMRDTELREFIQEADRRRIRIASICTGSFILAESGILDGRKCTTHWSDLERFRKLFPHIEVLSDVIFHNEDHIWTSAGVSTGIDMSLEILARDFGNHTAKKVAQNLILYMARPGYVEQISDFISDLPSVQEKMQDLLVYIKTTPNLDHSVPSMAARCNMSTRNFTRKFKNNYGKSPAAMVREVRVERAEFYMEKTEYTLKRIANLAGFSSVDVMRHAIYAVRRDKIASHKAAVG